MTLAERVLRVTGGDLRGRRVHMPRGGKVRPAGGRVREAIFNLLGHHLHGLRVLDLYAGSGILGIEALSRGAAHAVFVEKDPAVAAVLARNLAGLDLTGRTEIIRQDVNRFLKNMEPPGGKPFELVFLDPPFSLGLALEGLTLLQAGPWLAPGARVVVKHGAGDDLAAAPPGLERIRWREYGSTHVSLFLSTPPHSAG